MLAPHLDFHFLHAGDSCGDAGNDGDGADDDSRDFSQHYEADEPVLVHDGLLAQTIMKMMLMTPRFAIKTLNSCCRVPCRYHHLRHHCHLGGPLRCFLILVPSVMMVPRLGGADASNSSGANARTESFDHQAATCAAAA